jgi:leucyl aminopeptidase
MKIQPYQPSLHIADSIYLISTPNELDNLPLSDHEKKYLLSFVENKTIKGFPFNRYGYHIYVQVYDGENQPGTFEKLRREGDRIADYLRREKTGKAVLYYSGEDTTVMLALAEGIALGAYRFQTYKSIKEDEVIFDSLFINDVENPGDIQRLENIVNAVYMVRDLVNEPPNELDAVIFAQRMAAQCSEAGATVTILNQSEIQGLGMNGLLTVNKGSKTPSTFTVIEWKPGQAINQQPVVLVGKGLVFDTGGINLKPTMGLDTMKSDMAGGAAVFGTLYALALNKVPVHVVGLIPATDNRPGELAMVPGDIIRMGNGKTVEILNTDAEGRLILADALLYAAGYNPSLVIDIATLTGAAQVALGRFAIAGMHKEATQQMKKLMESSFRVNERIVELPFWDDYDKEIESDIADIRNIGKGKGGGTITAGKFLSHFITYPWIHLDIAAMAFMDARESYMGKGATAVGVRLLYDYIENMSGNNS